jgi:hypothetical protein
MKIYFTTLLFLFSTFGKVDSVPAWDVFYNNKLIKSFIEGNTRKEMQLKASEYKPGDYLAIHYTDDTPCKGCSYELEIVTDAKTEVFFLKTSDKYKLMKIDLKAIIEEYKSFPRHDFFIVYFTEISKSGKRNSGPRLFTIHLD